MKPKVSIIIISWNTKALLRRCLNSIYSCPPRTSYEVIVVDNASSDGSTHMVQREFPQVRLITNEINWGYAKAANQAIVQNASDYVFVLNSDTEILSEALDALVGFAGEHQGAGAIGPKLLNPDGSVQLSCRRFPSLGTGIGHAFLGLFSSRNPYTRTYRLADWDHCSIREVDWISGAAMFLRRSALDDTGLFDESYFMYVEDVDLCFRLWQAGWKIYYEPSAQVIHHVAQSSKLSSPWMIMEHHKSLYRFIAKNSSGYMRFMDLPIGAGLILRGGLAAAVSAVKNGLGRRFGGSKAEGQ